MGGEALPLSPRGGAQQGGGRRRSQHVRPDRDHHLVHELAHGRDAAAMSPSAGPSRTPQLYVLDRHRQPVPVGVPGELFIGGDGVARGYLNRPELTAERFVADPFSADPAAPLYRTGDLARYRPDGSLDFIGRVDHQVKIRGHRIELGEIEATLTRHPAVREAVVVAHEDESKDKRLVAYLVVKPADAGGDGRGGEDARPPDRRLPAADELQNSVRQSLPEYMVPAAFVFLDRLPLTPNGKVDRRALPGPDKARPVLREMVVESRDEVERQLVQIWERLLDVRPVGVTDDFFALGGDSLLVVEMALETEKVFSRAVSLATVISARTIRRLADVLREEPASKGGGDGQLDGYQEDVRHDGEPAAAPASRAGHRHSHRPVSRLAQHAAGQAISSKDVPVVRPEPSGVDPGRDMR